jgi:hypothetical protein
MNYLMDDVVRGIPRGCELLAGICGWPAQHVRQLSRPAKIDDDMGPKLHSQSHLKRHIIATTFFETLLEKTIHCHNNACLGCMAYRHRTKPFESWLTWGRSSYRRWPTGPCSSARSGCQCQVNHPYFNDTKHTRHNGTFGDGWKFLWFGYSMLLCHIVRIQAFCGCLSILFLILGWQISRKSWSICFGSANRKTIIW